ncbi:MAG: hypothetical protein GXP63_01650, partial [DPANN group archaeon]|nr:hypothetical protein [DPANN group archaeon]
MPDKRLADWIKSEEAQGYDEAQLETYLLREGYTKKNIREAITLKDREKTSHSLFRYIKSASYLLVTFWIIAFLFLSYAFDKIYGGIIILAIVSSGALSIDGFHRKKRE